jgi:hypothetical protein
MQGGDAFHVLAPLLIFAGILCIAAPLAALIGGVGRGIDRAGIPFAWVFGLLALPLMFVSMVGDPLVWVLHKIKPEWVGLERFGFINPTFLFVTKPVPSETNAISSESDDDAVPVVKRRKYEGI